VAASGGEAVPFLRPTPALSATRADWGANGKVAFTGTAPDGSSSVWIADGDGGNAHPLAVSGAGGQLFYPSWYPDAKSLVVMDGTALTLMRLCDRRRGDQAHRSVPGHDRHAQRLA
jgi:hypothetical protein